MISPHVMEPHAPIPSTHRQAANQTAVSSIMDVAEFCGWQEDGKGGRFQLWNLTKPLGCHPKGSTLTRATVLRLLGVEDVK